MIRLETYDLVGMALDVMNFAPSARDARELAYVRFNWTGERLEVSSHAVTHGAIATWTPRDNLDGDDEAWEVILRTVQVKDLTKLFELKGTRGWTPVTLDHHDDVLVISRPGDEDEGIDPRKQAYAPMGEYRDMHPADQFSDLGEIDLTQRIAHAQGVLTGLQKAVKRTGEPAYSTPHAKGIRTTVGRELVVYSRYPLEVDEAKEHADTVTAVALEQV